MTDSLVDRVVRLKPFMGSEVLASLSFSDEQPGQGLTFHHRAWGFVAIEWTPDVVPGRFRDGSPYRWIYASRQDLSEIAEALGLRPLFDAMSAWKSHEAAREAIEAEQKLLEARMGVDRYRRRVARLDERNERYYRGHTRKDYVESLCKKMLEESEAEEAFRHAQEWAATGCVKEFEKLARILGFHEGSEPGGSI